MSTPSNSTRSIFSFAWSAIHAGHAACASRVSAETRSDLQRNELVLSGIQENVGVTAEDWGSFWGGGSRETWRDEDLGAGTPLVSLYLFGYCWGKHSFGLLSGTLLIILPCWGGLLVLTLADGKIFWEMWTSVMTSLLMFSITLVARVSRRTPSGMTLFSTDVCVGLCLETLLTNTMTCVVHLIAVLPGEWRDVLGEATWVGRFIIVLSPFCLWYVLHHQGLDIQAATLRGQNMATMYGGGRGRIPSLRAGPHFQAIICRCIVSIIENSRDLRVTGLSSQQLERLAVIIGDRKEAEYIRFFIKGRKACPNVFDILYAFYQGYTYKGDHAHDYKRVRGWIDDWMENKVDDDPLGAIIKVSQEKEPRDCSEALAAICPVRGKMGQNWWLCGLAANVCDEIVSGRGARLPNPPDGVCVEEIKSIDGVSSHNFFALFAAALTINRNPLTVILMGDVKRQARDMLSIMEVGCKQVLRHTTDNGYIYAERGLVLCIPSNGARAAAAAGTRPEGPVRVVTYSAGEVWQAEQRREPVMIGTDAFNTLWRALMTENRSLNIHERQKLLDDSVEWSGKVLIHADYGRAFASLGPEGRTRVHVRDAARRGWYTHALWVVLAIFLHIYLPHHLIAMALLSVVALVFIKADQYTMVVYVGCRMWRSDIGKICRFIPPMIQEDLERLSTYAFWIVVMAVNLGGAYLGSIAQTPIGKLVFFSLLLGSVAPGLWYCVLCEDKGAENGQAVVGYIGRKRGKGYRHRDIPGRFRPLGKDVLEREHTEGIATSELTDGILEPTRATDESYSPESGGVGSTFVRGFFTAFGKKAVTTAPEDDDTNAC